MWICVLLVSLMGHAILCIFYIVIDKQSRVQHIYRIKAALNVIATLVMVLLLKNALIHEQFCWVEICVLLCITVRALQCLLSEKAYIYFSCTCSKRNLTQTLFNNIKFLTVSFIQILYTVFVAHGIQSNSLLYLCLTCVCAVDICWSALVNWLNHLSLSL